MDDSIIFNFEEEGIAFLMVVVATLVPRDLGVKAKRRACVCLDNVQCWTFGVAILVKLSRIQSIFCANINEVQFLFAANQIFDFLDILIGE